MSKRVIVFTTPRCPWCRKVKSYLRQNRVRFKDIDITKDERAARDIVRKTGKKEFLLPSLITDRLLGSIRQN